MSQAVIVIVIVAIVIVLVALGWYSSQRRTRERLRDQFGPEYDRTVSETGSEREAQRELAERRERVEQLRLRDLDPRERDRFSAEWDRVQARFVDEPRQAVAEGDRLVTDVMQARGYPMGDFDQRAADISVDHPDVVEHYRAAHDIAGQQDADTEALREAMVHERALFSDLLGSSDAQRGGMPAGRMEGAR
jgi:FtsZ-interacting cell division protein ZipA